MFRSAPVAEPAPVDTVTSVAVGLIPLSHLALDMDEPTAGWDAFLTVRNLMVLTDDIGRPSITRADARLLLDEQREHERRVREVAKQQEEAAIAADRAFRAALPKGVSWWELPDGVSPAEAWRAAELAAQPKRESVLQHALSNSGELEYHPLPSTADES